MKLAKIATVFISLLGLAACGGAGTGSYLAKNISGDLCRMEGASLVFTVPEKGFSEDCTVLVGKEGMTRPVDFELTGDSVRFAKEDIDVLDADTVFIQCGDGEKTIACFLPAKDGETDTNIAPNGDVATGGTTGGSTGDETITPGDPATPPASPTRPTTPGLDLHLDPGLISHLSKSNDDSSAVIKTFKVEKSENPNNFMTLKVSYDFTGAKQAYIFGNIFNSIAVEPATNRCDQSADGRFRVVNDDGNELIEGSADFENKWGYLARGKECNVTDASTDNDCVLTQEALAALQSGGPQYSQTNPTCRMDLTKNGAIANSDVFYTRSYARHGRACLAVQDTNDQWVVECRMIKAPEVDVQVDKMEISKDGPYVDVKLNYVNAAEEPKLTVNDNKATCTIKAHDFTVQNGSGSKEYHCDMTHGDIDLTLKANGVGQANSNLWKKTYRVRLEAPKFTFDYNDQSAGHGLEPMIGCFPPGNGQNGNIQGGCPGTLKFKWSVSRNYTIKDEDNADSVTGGDHTTFWADKVEFYEGSALKKTIAVGTNQHEGIIEMQRRHAITSWKAKAYDFAAYNTILSRSFTWGYAASFKTGDSHDAAHGQGGYDLCDGATECDGDETSDSCDPWGSSNDCGYCVETTDGWYQMTFDWTGTNIKSIKAECTTNLGTITTDISPVVSEGVASYGQQFGTIKVTTGHINADNWSSTTSCTFTATTYDGQTLQDAHSASHQRGPWTRDCTYNDDD